MGTAASHDSDCIEQALRVWQTVLNLQVTGGAEAGLITTHTQLGGLFRGIGNWEQALLHFEQALTRQQQQNDREGMAKTLGNIGSVCYLSGDLDAAYVNVYRAHVGDYRVFYSIGQGWVKLLSVRKRDERTYEDELPDVAPPATAPDHAALEPQQSQPQQGIGYGASGIEAVSAHVSDTLSPQPSSSLPHQLTDTILAQWQIPAAHWPVAQAARTEDDLLERAIPERFLHRNALRDVDTCCCTPSPTP